MALSEPNPVPKVLRRGYSSVADDVTLTDPPPPGSIPRLGRRVYLVNVAVFLFIFCLAIEGPLSVQFIYYRLKQHSFNGTADENMTTCLANHSDSKNDKYNKIQATAAEIQIFLAISTGIPSIIACVIFGTLSDRFGRRFLLALPVCGVLVRSVIYGVVNEYDLSLYYLLIGTTADGLCGGFSCFLLGAFAGSADVTAGGRRRSFLIAFVEASSTLSLGLGSLCLGFLIDGCGYTIPNVVAAVISVLNLGMIIFAVPETHSRKAEQRLTFKEIKILLLRVISFYVKKGGRFKRLRFSICWMAFFLTSVTYIGSASVETLFMKNYPLCWDSISIGYFIGLKSVCQAIAVVGLIKLLQYWFGDIWIGVICAVGKIAAFILQGFATTDVEMYLVAVIGMAAIGVMAMLRSIMSKSTPREELGAMFAGVAVAEATTTMVGGVMFNGIYQATLANMPGLIFFVMAAILGSVVILFGFLHCLIRLEKRNIKSDDERRPLNGKVEFF